MELIGFPELIVVVAIVVSLLVVVWPAARICRRLGFSPWLGLLVVVPVGNVVLLWYIAIAEWPDAPRSA